MINLLRKAAPKLSERLPLRKMLLFGSYAKNQYTIASDIDIFIVYGGPKRSDAYDMVVKMVDIIGLQPHIYSEEEYEALRRHRLKFIEEVEKRGVPIISK